VLLGATVLCILVMLVLLAERLGSRIWHGGGGHAFYRCEACDLRDPRSDIKNPRLHTCPAGHPVALEPGSATASFVGIFACLGFITVAALLIVTGVVH
jgi:hypothetical protein